MRSPESFYDAAGNHPLELLTGQSGGGINLKDSQVRRRATFVIDNDGKAAVILTD